MEAKITVPSFLAETIYYVQWLWPEIDMGIRITKLELSAWDIPCIVKFQIYPLLAFIYLFFFLNAAHFKTTDLLPKESFAHIIISLKTIFKFKTIFSRGIVGKLNTVALLHFWPDKFSPRRPIILRKNYTTKLLN